MIKTEKTHKRDCTYCSACINICKVGAITKEFDENRVDVYSCK